MLQSNFWTFVESWKEKYLEFYLHCDKDISGLFYVFLFSVYLNNFTINKNDKMIHLVSIAGIRIHNLVSLHYTSGQSYKASMSVNYGSRVVDISSLLVSRTLEP